MIQMIEPDFKIYIGIKNDKVMLVDWHESMNYNNIANEYKKQIKKYLKQAIKYLDK